MLISKNVALTLLAVTFFNYVHSFIDEKNDNNYSVKYTTNFTENGDKVIRAEVHDIGNRNVKCNGIYHPLGNKTGWNIITLWANPILDSEETADCLGLVEGSLTRDLIYEFYYNTVSKFCEDKKDICKKIEKFVDQNTKWIHNQIEQYKHTSSYWYQVGLVYKQIEGLERGYRSSSNLRIPNNGLVWINLAGDLEDLEDKFKPKGSPPRKLYDEGHCSAIIKLLPNNKDLYVGHNTWVRYNYMTRLLKKISMNFAKINSSEERIPGTNTSFSGYPGAIHSIDDFYLTSAGLAVQETTVGNSNRKLWKYVKPEGTVFEFVRVTVANRLARNGSEWTKIFSKYNSGTYNNQWMIVDYNKFRSGKTPKKDLLWVLEQIPGHIRAEDQTKVLVKQTYWPSYNVPFYKDIFKLAGNVELVKKYGPWFSYNGAPRAKIFKRDHSKIKCMGSFFNLMRSNNYKTDEFSKCDCTPPYSASNAIASRHDLNPKNGTYPIPYLGNRPGGAIDAKLVNSSLIKNLKFVAVSGPTNGNKQLPIFNWRTSEFKQTLPHLGQPDEWNFKPILFNAPISNENVVYETIDFTSNNPL